MNICLKCLNDPPWQSIFKGGKEKRGFCESAQMHLIRVGNQVWEVESGPKRGQFDKCKGYQEKIK